MKAIKTRLTVLNFLEFAVWGAYLTSLGTYLVNVGLQGQIGWFYAIQGVVSIFMPGLVGIIADRWVQAQRMLSLCHLLAGLFMLGAGWYAATAGQVEFGPLFTFYSLSVAFFMPTIGLANSVAYTALGKAGLDTIKHFPPIRMFGTVGFIVAMLVTNFAGFQATSTQLTFSGIISLVMAAYALTMPECPTSKHSADKRGGFAEAMGLKAFALFKDKRMAIFFIFSMLLGVSLQITNGFANPFITGFGSVPQFADTWGVHNANALISLSQMSEALCILLIPFLLKRYGIKVVMMIAMLAWVLRFGFFGLGDPGSGVWLLVLSMIIYGVAFDFFNVSGSLYVDQQTTPEIRSSAQGLFMIMTNGIGATLGTLGAQKVIDCVVFSQPDGTMARIAGWSHAWMIFAAYALVVAVLFFLLFKNPHKSQAHLAEAKKQAESDPMI